ncbi:MAG: hypothetical protein EBU84_19175 [Actinobacteria bacterium]|nr:hypothetical protein [Actinomycetota bacterium]
MMASRHHTFTLNSTTPTQITGIHDLNNRRGVTIVLNSDKNNNNSVFIGANNTVSTTDFGWHADADDTLVLSGEFTAEDTLWAIADANTPKIHVLVMGG